MGDDPALFIIFLFVDFAAREALLEDVESACGALGMPHLIAAEVIALPKSVWDSG